MEQSNTDRTDGQKVLSPDEAAAFTEFKRERREAEALLTLKKLIADASRRETDKALLKKICAFAMKSHAGGVLVSPVHAAAARKLLLGSGVRVVCIVGGNGETLPSVKKYEAKRAAKAGAEEIRLIPCYSALISGNLTYLKKEIKKVKRAARGCAVVLSLEDHSLGEEDVALGTRAACESGISGVCVRGETALLLVATEVGAGKITVECSCVENAEQLRTLQGLGALHLVSPCPEKIAEELFASLAAERPL